MIGTSEQPALKAKAAESKGLLQFVEHLMQKLIPRFEAQANMKDKQKLAKLLWESTEAALSFEKALKTDGRFMTRLQVLEALSSYKRFLVLYEKAGGPMSPKCHLMYHLIQNCMAKGNPRRYSTYRDETFNAVVAKVARSCHRRTWFNAIHFKFSTQHRKAFEAVKKQYLKGAR